MLLVLVLQYSIRDIECYLATKKGRDVVSVPPTEWEVDKTRCMVHVF